MIPARYILAIVGAVFLALAVWRIARRGKLDPASRTWLIVGTVFLAVSGLLLTTVP